MGPTRLPVIIGYGNPLRQDDGMGWRAAELLQARLAPGAAELHMCHQLMPEMAALLAGAPLILFLDASVEQAPGKVVQYSPQPERGFASSHSLTPEQLLGWTLELHGTVPRAVVISGGVFNMDLADHLTEGGEICAARMAELAISLLNSY